MVEVLPAHSILGTELAIDLIDLRLLLFLPEEGTEAGIVLVVS